MREVNWLSLRAVRLVNVDSVDCVWEGSELIVFNGKFSKIS